MDLRKTNGSIVRVDITWRRIVELHNSVVWT